MRGVSLAALAALTMTIAGVHSFARQESQTPAAAKAAAVVNLNTANAAQLEALPGIGPKTAARIVEYRQKNGGFKKIEELMNVRGVGEKSFLKLKHFITVTPMKPEHGGNPSAQ